MEIILLERVEKLGQMGDVVKVKDGYARNFLLPQKKALRSTAANRERFERERAQLEARNLERRQEAEKVGEKLNGRDFVVIRQAGESGQLYGSVTSRDIADLVTDQGVSVARSQVSLDTPIKTIGVHAIKIVLHPEVSVTVSLNVARSPEEAQRQARGEILTGEYGEPEEALEAEEIFETAELAEAAEQALEEESEAETEPSTGTEEASEEDEPQA